METEWKERDIKVKKIERERERKPWRSVSKDDSLKAMMKQFPKRWENHAGKGFPRLKIAQLGQDRKVTFRLPTK